MYTVSEEDQPCSLCTVYVQSQYWNFAMSVIGPGTAPAALLCTVNVQSPYLTAWHECESPLLPLDI